ncbi:hypothetical protein BXZ70DRAFT_77521 [Cristinia sonorae]|uniref:Uncharacterized protein n=1 Tax=Cristinia sonorae TaxID=1940300 RepID=A0A8K0UQG0_9AGAR|nr:hypothetical protein BXZ70DRAFT_77521 [Cristinia sonorae]
MGDILPEYKAYHEELHRAINNPPDLPSTDLRSAADGIATTADSHASESELLDEINKMAGAAAEVDKSFGDVSKLFLNVRNGMSSPAVKADMRKLEDRWNAHHQKYKSLLWRSRQVAGKAQAAADDFARDFVLFLGEDGESIEVKKREIHNYIEVLKKDEQASEDMAQGFADLRTNIVNLVADWRGLVKKYNIDAISARIEKLKSEMDTLAHTLADLNAKISQLSIALSMTWGFFGVITSLCVFAPVWGFNTLILQYGGYDYIQLWLDLNKATKERDDVSRKYVSKIIEYILALPELLQVQELQGTLQKSEGDIDNIITRLAGFAKVWAMIRTDVQAISEKLDYVVGTESDRLFKSRLNSTAKLYALLGKALYRYQIIITDSHPAFVGMVHQ